MLIMTKHENAKIDVRRELCACDVLLVFFLCIFCLRCFFLVSLLCCVPRGQFYLFMAFRPRLGDAFTRLWYLDLGVHGAKFPRLWHLDLGPGTRLPDYGI